MPDKTALAIRHVAFQDLGSLAGPLQEAGYSVSYHDAAGHDLTTIDPLDSDLLIVLGGPMGVYEDEQYPTIATEIEVLKSRLEADRPTVGICLGAQLMAHSLGSRVYRATQREIGWSPITLTEEGRNHPLRDLQDHAVLHWHGDTFDLPEGCSLLASTAACRNQAFARGQRVLGLQFHPEIKALKVESWLMGLTCELHRANVDPRRIRADAVTHAPRLERASQRMFSNWLASLE
ncbi:glutamine amidotransferase [Ensifer sp. ENS04]|uniref:glutamine amidotransferase n=1 Tax=Ensifer sp. ENS04 TaxID=2769281 RepID=UPI001781F5A5|nr:glutamine amidotransferase [Ensifer sp. ENS04]MBD9544759.1 glutamine amidotransferase [Ensifer sp. ENS04]